MKVLVTGAAGFIGSHLCERLLLGGCSVLGIDNFDSFYDPAVKRRNLKESLSYDSFVLIEADIRDENSMNEALKRGVDVIVHLAAKAGVRPSIENPVLYADVNIMGTVVVLEAARKNGVKKFVFGSSSSVYGNNKKVPFSENDNVDFPISPYAATKKACELLCYTYYSLYGIDMTCLRFFTVYGPRQRPDLAIHKFVKLIEQSEPIPFFGDGNMMRDFTYIDDIVAGIVAAIDKCDGYNIYNLGKSEPIKLGELVEQIELAMEKKASKEYLPWQPGDVEKTYADIGKAIKDLGYKPSMKIARGLLNFIEWFRYKP